MNTPLAIINLGSTGDVPATIAYNSNPKKVGKFLDGLHTGAAVGGPKELAALLLSNHHNPRGKRVARTGVISVKTPRRASKQELEDIDQRLIQAFWDLQKLLKVPMLGWIHTNTQTRHLHLVFPNSNGVRCLDLRPRWLRQLQGFMWTMALLSGRGRGRRKALPVYPKARSVSARDLAQVLVDGNGNIRQDKWDALVKAGQITNFRRRNDGSIVSFEWGGTDRRVRVATLKGFAIECLDTPPATQEVYETSLQYDEPGSPVEPLLGPNAQPQPGPVPPLLPQPAGQGQPGPLPVALTAKSVAGGAPGLVTKLLEQASASRPGVDVLASSGTPDAEPVDQNPLPTGGLALSGHRRFKRRASQQPAAAEVAPTPAPAPRFNRISRPGIGGL